MKSFKAGDRITFGKHKGLTIGRVSDVDPGYIEWMKAERIIDSDTLTRHHRGELIRKGDRLQQGYAKVWTGR